MDKQSGIQTSDWSRGKTCLLSVFNRVGTLINDPFSMFACSKCDFTALHDKMLWDHKNFHSTLHNVKVKYVKMLDELNRAIEGGVLRQFKMNVETVLGLQPGFLFTNLVSDIVDKLDKRKNIVFSPEKNLVDFAGLLACLRTKPMLGAFDLVYRAWEEMNRELGVNINISCYKHWRYSETKLESGQI